MATIRKRNRKKGTICYTAQIRIMCKGVQVYQESNTLDRKQIAVAWAARRETEMSEPGAIDRANRKGVTVKSMIERYLDEYERIRPLGKTKGACLKAISNTWLGSVVDSDPQQPKACEVCPAALMPAGVNGKNIHGFSI